MPNTDPLTLREKKGFTVVETEHLLPFNLFRHGKYVGEFKTEEAIDEYVWSYRV